MAGLFDALGTASRGLQVADRGIATTGHNIANANTPGYSRQKSIVRPGLPNQSGSGNIGSGAEQISVERIVDRFVGLRLISETSREATLSSEASIYQQIEAIVNDQLDGGLSSELTRFFGALDDLSNASEPGQAVARGQVLAAAESFIGTVGRWDDQLRGLQNDADRGVTGLLPDVNDLTAEIARLNGQISVQEVLAPANDLRDERDGLVLELAQKIDVGSVFEDNGMISVRTQGGLPLVTGKFSAELVSVVDPLNPNASDPTFAQVFYQGSGSSFDATGQIRGGELGGAIDARDKVIAQTLGDLDAFVFSFAETFNERHGEGLGLADDGSYDFFEDMSAQATVDGAARNLRLSTDIDPDRGGSLENIAAGQRPVVPDGNPAAEGDLRWVEQLKDLRDERIPLYLAGDLSGSPTGSSGSLSSSLVNVVGDVGQNSRSAARALEQQSSILASVQNRRDSISGVSIDEEVAGLIQLQTLFQANARVIQTVSGLMDDLLGVL